MERAVAIVHRFLCQKFSLVVLMLCSASSLAACGQASAAGVWQETVGTETNVQQTSTGTPQPSPTASTTPSPSPSASPSPTPSITPTLTPVPTFTATPTLLAYERLPLITLSNAGSLARLVRIPVNSSVKLPANFAFSPDSRRLALDGGLAVQVWDIPSGQVISELLPPDETYTPAGSLAFSPDGIRVARVYRQNQVIIWDSATGEILHELSAGPQTQAIFRLAFPSANRLAASAVTEGGSGLLVWDVLSGELVAETPSGSYLPDDFIVSPLGRMVVQAGNDGTLRFWESQTGRLISRQIIYACQDTLNGAAFSPDGRILAIQCETEGTRLYLYIPHYSRTGDLTLLSVQESEWRGNGQMSFNRDGALLAAAIGTPPRQILFWDMLSQSQLLMIDGLSGDVRQLTFSPDGRLLAFRLGDGSVELWGAQ